MLLDLYAFCFLPYMIGNRKKFELYIWFIKSGVVLAKFRRNDKFSINPANRNIAACICAWYIWVLINERMFPWFFRKKLIPVYFAWRIIYRTVFHAFSMKFEILLECRDHALLKLCSSLLLTMFVTPFSLALDSFHFLSQNVSMIVFSNHLSF